MLVLSRHKNEVIMIGDDVRIVVVAILGDKVKLGIKASKEIPVHRLEVYEAIKREGEKRERIMLARNLRVSANRGFIRSLRESFGQENVWLA